MFSFPFVRRSVFDRIKSRSTDQVRQLSKLKIRCEQLLEENQNIIAELVTREAEISVLRLDLGKKKKKKKARGS